MKSRSTTKPAQPGVNFSPSEALPELTNFARYVYFLQLRADMAAVNHNGRTGHVGRCIRCQK